MVGYSLARNVVGCVAVGGVAGAGWWWCGEEDSKNIHEPTQSRNPVIQHIRGTPR